jgi:magnesium transporter
MLTCFARMPDGSFEHHDSLDAVCRLATECDSSLWIDLEAPDGDLLQRVGGLFNVTPEALEDCIHGEQMPRIDEYEDHVLLMLYGFPAGIAEGHFEPKKLAVFCGSRFLLSVHQDRLQTIEDVRTRCNRHPQQWFGRGVDLLLYSVVDGMADRYAMLVEELETRLDQLEDRSFTSDLDDNFLTELSQLRRDLLEVRHIAASQRDVVAPIAKGECDYVNTDLETRFSHVRDHLTQVVEHIELLRELLNGARDNYHALIADRLADTVKTLTVFASVILPVSLVAGIYGMNLPSWPPSGEAWSFWVVLGAMGGIAAALLAYFRSRRWI